MTVNHPSVRALRPHPKSILLGAAGFITLFLYFIDEGRYSLEGLSTTGNLIAMAIYFVGLVAGLFTVSALFAHRTPGASRTALVLGLGTALGFVFGLLLILGVGALQRLG